MFNQVTIAGRITNELELKQTANGTSVLNFCVALNERRGEHEHTVFLDITAWNGTAENTAKFMGKGSPVLVAGRISQDKWEDEGRTRSKVFVTAERVVFLEPAKSEATPAPAPEPVLVRKAASKKEKAA